MPLQRSMRQRSVSVMLTRPDATWSVDTVLTIHLKLALSVGAVNRYRPFIRIEQGRITPLPCSMSNTGVTVHWLYNNISDDWTDDQINQAIRALEYGQPGFLTDRSTQELMHVIMQTLWNHAREIGGQEHGGKQREDSEEPCWTESN